MLDLWQEGKEMLRIIDKKSNLFTRDDFTFDEETEIGLDVAPAQGLFKPKWDDGEWVEGATQEEIDELTKPRPQEPTEIDLLHAQVKASNDYVDFLEEVVVELIQEVYK